MTTMEIHDILAQVSAKLRAAEARLAQAGGDLGVYETGKAATATLTGAQKDTIMDSLETLSTQALNLEDALDVFLG